MKKKNAFTLIELLAIIVILAIIAVITVPIILNVIENSKKGAVQDSALGYKDAVQKYYMSELYNSRAIKLDGNYTISEGNITGVFDGETEETKEIPVSGTKPTNGILTYSNNKLTSGCLTFGEYKTELNADGTITTTKGDCNVEIDVTGGLRERVLTLYANEIASAKNYFIVYRNNFESADLILYPSQNYNFQIRITEPSNKNTNIPYFDLHIIGSYTAYAGITMESPSTSTYTGTERFFSGIQTSAPNNVSIEMPIYPTNINNYQIYKNNFGKIPTTENYRRINLDEVLTLPSSYNNTPCRDYMVLTYSGNAQFYCITGDATFTYDTTNKRLNFNYNNGHMYRYKYNTNNWNIVFHADVNWNSLNNYDYMNNDILDIIVLSTFDIKDTNNNIVYPKNTTIEKLTTNYVAQ